MCWRRPEREDGDVVSKRDQSQACRDRGIFMDRLQVARTFRPPELQSHVRSAFREDAEGEMPFDMKRMLYGGFKTIVEA